MDLFLDVGFVFDIGGLDGVGPHGLVLEAGQHLVAAFGPVLKRP